MRLLPVVFLPLLACKSEPEGPTWHQDIAPFVAEHCGSCHTEGGVAPVALDTYAQVDGFAPAMLAAMDSGTMPPFLAQDDEDCVHERPFRDDLRLTDEQIALFAAWVEADRPEGDPDTATAIPDPPNLGIDAPDVSLPFASAFTVAGDEDVFQCFVLDPGNADTTMWVDAIQLVPDNPRVDHHGLIFLDVNGEADSLATDGTFPCFNNPSVSGYLMATWVPGALPMRTPETAAMPVPPGAKLIVQMHYHPVPGESHTDQSKVELTWSETEPDWAAAQFLIGNDWRQNADGTGLQPGPNDTDPNTPEFRIPAGVSDHTETMIFRSTLPLPLPLFSVGTHMHYVGTDMSIQLRPGGVEADQECLVGTPQWDFNWQRTYDYALDVDDMPKVGNGDELHMTCTYDNTMDNPFVAEALAEQGITAPQEVLLGEETLDEMCLGLFGILVPPALVESLY